MLDTSLQHYRGLPMQNNYEFSCKYKTVPRGEKPGWKHRHTQMENAGASGTPRGVTCKPHHLNGAMDQRKMKKVLPLINSFMF